MTLPIHDVAIIGGGPAGSTAATLLARSGLDTVVLERETFPRFHIGESLLPYNLPIFDDLGVREKISSAGFVRKLGARFLLADGSHENAFRFADGSFTEHSESFQVDRATFDHILLDHAAASGAEVRQGVRVTGHKTGESHATLETSDGPLHSSFVIDASGQDNFTATRQHLRSFHQGLKKIAVFGHFTGIDLPDGPSSGDILIFRLARAWFWFIPLSNRRISLGLVTDSSALNSSSPDELFNETIARSPALSALVASRQPVGRLRTLRDFSYSNSELVSDRLVRVGDAAGFLDPIFSSGVYLAMLTAQEAAPSIVSTLASGRSLSPSLKQYEKRTRRRYRTFLKLIRGFYSDPFIDLFLQPQHGLRIPCAVNALLSGRTDLPWQVRWRLASFHLLGRLQRHLPVVPRLTIPK